MAEDIERALRYAIAFERMAAGELRRLSHLDAAEAAQYVREIAAQLDEHADRLKSAVPASRRGSS